MRTKKATTEVVACLFVLGCVIELVCCGRLAAVGLERVVGLACVANRCGRVLLGDAWFWLPDRGVGLAR